MKKFSQSILGRNTGQAGKFPEYRKTAKRITGRNRRRQWKILGEDAPKLRREFVWG